MTYAIYGLSQKCFVNQSQEERSAPSKFQKIASRVAPLVDAAIIGLSLTFAALTILRGGAQLNLGPINALGGLGWYPALPLMGLTFFMAASDAITLGLSCRKPKQAKQTKAEREAAKAKRNQARADKEVFLKAPKQHITYLAGPRPEKSSPRAAVIDLAQSQPVELKRVLAPVQVRQASSGPFVGINEKRELVLVSLTEVQSGKKTKEVAKHTSIGIYPTKSERGERTHLLILESDDGTELQGVLVNKEVADQLFNIPVADNGGKPPKYKPYVAKGLALYTLGQTLKNKQVQTGEIVIGHLESGEATVGVPLEFIKPKPKKKKNSTLPLKDPGFQLFFDTSLTGLPLKKA